MPIEYAYPTSVELMEIEQDKLPYLTMNDPLFEWFPIVDSPNTFLQWTQKDNFKGMQQFRGLDGEPQRINRVGQRDWMYRPGVYGEYGDINETELMNRRPWGNSTGFIDISDLVSEIQDQLLDRRIVRIRWILWTLLLTGAFYVPANNIPGAPATEGAAGHGDAYNTVNGVGQFGMQSYTAAIPWTTLATSTPLLNFREMQITAARGRSVEFGSNATALMNRTTFLQMVRNQNGNDLGGKTTGSTFSTLTSPADVNKVMVDADVPTIRIFDDGYFDETGAWQLWIPDGTVLVIGARSNNAKLGEYRMTRNTVNEGFAPGPYTFVNDSGLIPNARKVPRSIQVHDGHNGGPVLFYPSAVIRMDVY